MTSIRYRPEIDGLRALAVIPVILFHMDIPWLPGGFAGVDVFFVISGFLITSIIKAELEAGTFSLRQFWGRRVRRILPALIVVSLTTLIFACGFVFRPDLPGIAAQAIAGLLSVANIFFWLHTDGYWSDTAEAAPFLHTWSLSIEEQFYLVFPVLMLAIFRYRPRWFQGALLLIILSSLTLFVYGSSTHPTATFYLLPARAWELATGGLLAFTIQSTWLVSAKSRPGLAIGGLSLLIASYFFLTSLGLGLISAVLGAALIIAFAETGMVNRLLSNSPVVHIGRLSYSLYLWHWPVIVFATYLGMQTNKVLLLPLIYLLSLGSYNLIEKPTRRQTASTRKIVAVLSLAVASATVMSVMPAYYDAGTIQQAHWYGAYYDLRPDNEMGEDFRRITETIETPQRDAPPDAYKNGGIILGDGTDNPRIVVLGDSHGTMWSDAIRSATKEMGVKVSFISINGVTPFISLPVERDQKPDFMTADQKFAYDLSRIKLLQDWKPELVIIAARWEHQSTKKAKDLLEYLDEKAIRSLLIEQPPVLKDVGNRNALQFALYRGLENTSTPKVFFPAGNAASVDFGRQLIRGLADRYQHTDIVAVHDIYEHDSKTLLLDGDNVVYVDDDHLTTYGALLAKTRIEQSISNALSLQEAQKGSGLRITHSQ